MSFFAKLFGKKDKGDSRADWPWTLTVAGRPVSAFAWEDILRELKGLTADRDSFLILEQRDPQDSGRYWYLQSARALRGEHAGQYIVGCGYSDPKGPVLLERYCGTLGEVIPLFEDAYRQKPLDLSLFEDHSSWLPASRRK